MAFNTTLDFLENKDIGSNLEGNSSSGQSKSIFWFSEVECTAVGILFILGSISGSLANLSVLTVLVHVIYRESVKSGSDFLIAVLTFLDLLATTVVFIWEASHFLSPDCNEAPSDSLFVITFFLETSSAFSLLNIAIFRYTKICLVNIFDINYNRSVVMTALNIIISAISTTLVVLCNNPDLNQLAMMIYFCTIFVIFIVMGVLYLKAYCALRQRSNQARDRNATRLAFAQRLDNTANQPNPAIEIPPEEHHEPENHSPKAKHQSRKWFRKLQHSTQNGTDLTHNQNSGPGQEHQPVKSTMELMTERSGKVFIVITNVYIICFIPNAFLTLLAIILGKRLYGLSLPFLMKAAFKYSNLFYNINFFLMPTVYAKLNKRFTKEYTTFLQRFISPCRKGSRAGSGRGGASANMAGTTNDVTDMRRMDSGNALSTMNTNFVSKIKRQSTVECGTSAC